MTGDRRPAVALSSMAGAVVWCTSLILFGLPLLSLARSHDLMMVGRLLLLAFGVLAAIRPTNALLIYAALMPLSSVVAPLLGMAIRGTALAEVLTLELVFGWLVHRGWRRNRERLVDPNVAASACALAAIALASAVSSLPEIGLRTFEEGPLGRSLWQLASTDYLDGSIRFHGVMVAMVMAECAALLVLAATQAEPLFDRRRVAQMAVAGGVAAALLNLYRLFSAALERGAMWNAVRVLTVQGRISMLLDRNAAGSYFAMVLIVSAAFWSVRRWGIATGAASAIIAAALWLTGSRAALAAALIAGVLLALLRGKASANARTRRAAVVAAIVVAISSVAIAALYPVGRNPALQASVRGRTELVIAALHMISAHPWAGVGIGRFYDLSGSYGRPQLLDVLPPNNPHENAHNNFLQVGAELGIPGLLALLWLLVEVGAGAWRKPDKLSPLNAALFAGALAYVLTWLTGHPLLEPESAYPFFLVAGLAAAAPVSQPGTPTNLSKGATAALVIVLLLLLPHRLTLSAQQADLEHISYGMSPWQHDPEIDLYQWADPDSTLFAPTDAVIVLPLRRNPAAGVVDVEVLLDARPANRIVLSNDAWHLIRIQIPPTASRYSRIDLRVTDAAVRKPLMVGKLREYPRPK